MIVSIKPIDKTDSMDSHYREFDRVESIDDSCYPLIKIRHENHEQYVMMRVPDNCYLLVIKED